MPPCCIRFSPWIRRREISPHIARSWPLGARAKLLYRDGLLFDAKIGRELQRWKVRKEIIVPPDCSVSLETEGGAAITLRDDSEAVWLEQGGQRTALEGTKSAVKVPDSAGRKFPLLRRVLHQELLVNIVEAGPVPNFFVDEKSLREVFKDDPTALKHPLFAKLQTTGTAASEGGPKLTVSS